MPEQPSVEGTKGQVLTLLAEGKRQTEIARELKISKQRVSKIVKTAGVAYPYAHEFGKRVSKKCANPACQNRIEGSPSWVKQRRHCSRQCALVSMAPRVVKETRLCAECSKPVTRPSYYFRSATTFCSHLCSAKYLWEKKHSPG